MDRQALSGPASTGARSQASESRAGARPTLSVVIPALDEAAQLPPLLGDLGPLLAAGVDVVVADGGSRDATREVAARGGARVVPAPRGRGVQLAAGAGAATGEWLWFVHADARVSRLLLALVMDLVEADDRRTAWWCPLRIDGDGWRYRFVEMGTNRRSRWAWLPYGDQGLLLHRSLYEAAGGYDPVPLMEDVALVRRLRRVGRLGEIPAPMVTSGRRFARDGVLRRMLRNWSLLARWLLGASPESLARRYR